MTSRTKQITTHSPDETQQLGKKIGLLLDAGSVLALRGDLGSGKTVFVQGLARGLEVPAHFYITSPTYTLINEYSGRRDLFHVDLYRITGSEAEDIGINELLYGDGVVAIEWAEKIKDDLPADHLDIHFKITSNKTRIISINCHGHVPADLIRKLD